MSASGVDKSQLETVGRDFLMVKDFDDERGVIVLSVPPGIDPRRVSVDAIEHWMIYQEHPGVGAIVHVHAWVDGIEATDVNYPCGTEELARSVAELVRLDDDPDHAIVGLRNHGITVTGPSLEEILDRIEPHVLAEIPMS
jgi:ribulose-5-phosphate 4-epimerase/fuculose-1-phosphate aldolase